MCKITKGLIFRIVILLLALGTIFEQNLVYKTFLGIASLILLFILGIGISRNDFISEKFNLFPFVFSQFLIGFVFFSLLILTYALYGKAFEINFDTLLTVSSFAFLTPTILFVFANDKKIWQGIRKTVFYSLWGSFILIFAGLVKFSLASTYFPYGTEISKMIFSAIFILALYDISVSVGTLLEFVIKYKTPANRN